MQRRANLYRRTPIDQPMPDPSKYPSTPDGRYFVVCGRLWRLSNPNLAAETRQLLVNRLMDARRQVGAAKKAKDSDALRSARAAVDAAKNALGERGSPWWTDGAPDFRRYLAKNTPYAGWFESVSAAAPPQTLVFPVPRSGRRDR